MEQKGTKRATCVRIAARRGLWRVPRAPQEGILGSQDGILGLSGGPSGNILGALGAFSEHLRLMLGALGASWTHLTSILDALVAAASSK